METSCFNEFGFGQVRQAVCKVLYDLGVAVRHFAAGAQFDVDNASVSRVQDDGLVARKGVDINII
jgi:hypothetical protein